TVVATHGHSDHAGLGAAWQRAGAQVLLGVADAHFAAGRGLGDPAEFALLARFVDDSGAPADAAAEAIAGLDRRRRANSLAAADYPPAGRPPRWPTGLRFEPFTPDGPAGEHTPLPAGLCILAAPGHTPGNLVVIHEGEGWLFSGDQLLPEITPTPAIQSDPAHPGDRFPSLPAFVKSMSALAGMPFSRCYPGHGEPFDDVSGLIAANLGAIEQRTARVLDELQGGGPANLYDLSERLYPRALRRRFWQIAPTVLGHLDLLVESGAVTRRGGLYSVPA
ncbi:MAG: MBL fold metallo-hydrolase, partial [Dehalococcoidia bacterium]